MMDLGENKNFLAQAGHVGWGGFLTLLLGFWLGGPAALVMIGAALAKEVLESLGWAFWEPKQTWASSAIDALFWIVGILPAAAFQFLANSHGCKVKL